MLLYCKLFYKKKNKWDIYERFVINFMVLSNYNKGVIFVLCFVIVLICRSIFLENVNVVKGFGFIIYLGLVLFVVISWIN